MIVLTTFDNHEYVFEAMRRAASDFLVKDTKPADLVQAIHTPSPAETP